MPRLLSFLLVITLVGCGSSGPRPVPVTPDADSDSRRLSRIWNERVSEMGPVDYPIGSGDVIHISVTDLPELKDLEVRVTGRGMLLLPLIGRVTAGGLTEHELTQDIVARLQENVMRDPAVTLFVSEYRSRMVAVIGEVQEPGFYGITGPADTLLDMIAQGGGMTSDAAPYVQFLPAAFARRTPVGVNGEDPQTPTDQGGLPPVSSAGPNVKNEGAILIDLVDFRSMGEQMFLNLPVRPGDVIVVPERGEVFVEGAVERPGAYTVFPHMTVAGAVASAGGPRFTASTATVRVIRASGAGNNFFYQADLRGVQRGEEFDIPIEPGDIVKVQYSTPKLIVATIYDFTKAVLGFGRRLGGN